MRNWKSKIETGNSVDRDIRLGIGRTCKGGPGPTKTVELTIMILKPVS